LLFAPYGVVNSNISAAGGLHAHLTSIIEVNCATTSRRPRFHV